MHKRHSHYLPGIYRAIVAWSLRLLIIGGLGLCLASTQPVYGTTFESTLDKDGLKVASNTSISSTATKIGPALWLTSQGHFLINTVTANNFATDTGYIHISGVNKDSPLLGFTKDENIGWILNPSFVDKSKEEGSVYFSSNSGKTLLSTNGLGYVGVGTNTPETPLHITGDLITHNRINATLMSTNSVPIFTYITYGNLNDSSTGTDVILHFLSPKPSSSNAYIGSNRNQIKPDGTSAIGHTYIKSHIYLGTGPNAVLSASVANPIVTKSFIIPHPQKQDRYLIHAATEGPESAVAYSGTIELVNGKGSTHLPAYVASLVHNQSSTILFSTNTPNNPVRLVKSHLRWYHRIIETLLFWRPAVTTLTFESKRVIPGQLVHWEYKATRNTLDISPLKRDVIVNGQGPYRYLTYRKEQQTP